MLRKSKSQPHQTVPVPKKKIGKQPKNLKYISHDPLDFSLQAQKFSANFHSNSSLKTHGFYVLSGILHRWYKRELIFDEGRKIIVLKKKNKEISVQLSSYIMQNRGYFKKKWCFSLETQILKGTKNKKKAKRIIIGCDCKEDLENWIMVLAPHTHKNAEVSLFSPQSKHNSSQFYDDFVPSSSPHNIGFILSKYDNFIAKKDFISPSKILDQKKRIQDSLNPNLLEIFDEILELIEQKEHVFKYLKQNPLWNLVVKEEFIDKSFSIFHHSQEKTKARAFLSLAGYQAQEVFEALNGEKDWDSSLLEKKEIINKKGGKEIFVKELYKSCDVINTVQEFNYIKYSNRIKKSFFTIGKSIAGDNEADLEATSLVGEQNMIILVNKIVVYVLNYVEKEKLFAGILFEVDLNIPNYTQISKYLTKYLEKLKLFPLYKELPSSVEYLDINPLENLKESISHSKENELILSKKKHFENPFVFKKGNGENYPSINDLENFLKYFHYNYHIMDCISNFHEQGLLSIKEEECILDSNELQGHFAYKKEYCRAKKGGLNFIKSELMSEQKKVMLHLLKQAGSNLIHGRAIINVSLPVEIFEPRSFLERLARSFGHAPLFLEKGGTCNDIVEQMKWTLAFFFSSMVMCIQQEKPFNPILGETFQGRIKGCPIYLEQVKHHPPTTYYYMFGKNFKLYGSHEPVAKLSANSCVAEQRGSPVAEFLNNHTKITFRWPLFLLSGIVMGQRGFNFFSKAFAYNKEENLFCEIIFNINEIGGFKGLFQKKDYFIDEIGGAIYKVKPHVIPKYEMAKKPFKLELNHDNDVIKTICKIKGEWTSYIAFDDVKYWDIEKDRPYLLEYEKNCLPSDANFRDDVVYLRMGNKQQSQLKKIELEISQRQDKHLRENHKKKSKGK